MSNVIRLCHPVDFPVLLYHDQGNTFKGLFAEYLTTSINHVIKGTNLTFQVQPRRGMGKQVTSSENYDGCIGMMQRNESDIVMTLADYPVHAEYVTQGNIITDSAMQFITVYYTSDDTLDAQVLSCFESFSLDLWIMIIFTVAIIYSLLMVRSTVVKKILPRKFANVVKRIRSRTRNGRNRYHLYKIITHLTRIGRMNERGIFNKLLFIVLSLASLVLVIYFQTLIKTELVVLKKPDILKSYKDIIAKNVSVSFYHGLNFENYFKYAPEGSKEKILWDQTMSYSKEGQIGWGLDSRVEDLSSNITGLLSRKQVLFLDAILSPIIHVIACKLKSDEQQFQRFYDVFRLNGDYSAKSVKLYIGQDENAMRTLKTLLYSKYFSGTPYKVLDGRFKKFHEWGITEQLLLEVGKLDASDLFAVVTPKDEKKLKELRLCLEGIRITSKITLDALTIRNLHSFVYAISLLLLLTFIVYLVELLDVQLMITHDSWRISPRRPFP